MKKRILTVLLAVCLVVALGTVTAMADGDVTDVNELKTAVQTSGTIIIGNDMKFSKGDIVTIPQGVTIVLDMQGHSITVDSDFTGRPIINRGTLTVTGDGTIDSSASSADGLGSIDNYGTLTIENGTFRGSLNSNSTNIWNRSGGTMYINGGVFDTNPTQIATEDDSITVINGGSFTSPWYPAIENNGHMTINGGDFTNTSCSTCNGRNRWGYTIRSGLKSESSYLCINNCSVTGTQGGVAIVGGTADIYGGEYNIVDCTNGHGSAYYALYVTGESYETSTRVFGGTFEAFNKNALQIGNSNPAPDSGKGESSLVLVYDGVFIGGENSEAILVQDTANAIGAANVFGGTFKNESGTVTDVDAYIPEGAALTQDKNGTIVEDKTKTIVARVDGIGYTTLEAAIAAADSGDTVTLEDNITNENVNNDPLQVNDDNEATLLIVRKNITIVGNGHTIALTVPSGSATCQAISVGDEISTPENADEVTLTLSGVDMKIRGNGNGSGGDGMDVWSNATLNIVDGSNVNFYEVRSAFTVQGGSRAEINVENSTVMGNNVNGNFSNGGNWNLDYASVYINSADSYGLSVDNLVTTGDTNIGISNTVYGAIYAVNTIDLGSGTDVNISDCGTKLQYNTSNYGHCYAPIQIRCEHKTVAIPNGAGIVVREGATVTVTDTPNNVSDIYVPFGTDFTNGGTVNATVKMEDEEGQNTVTLISNGNVIYAGYVADNGSFKLPVPDSRNGYTFGGWRGSDGKVYKAGETVTITTNMTFTAIWNAVNIPDTYDIEIADTANGEVSTSLSNASAGSTITITAEPDTGYSVGSVTVTGPDGRVDVTRVNATTYTFKMPEGNVTVRVAFTTGLPFADVSANQWFYEAVSYVYTNGMMEGDSATTFNPDGRMTRAMFWAVLGRIDGATITGANWVETARSWAMAEGVSDGTNPNDYVTREMMVTMLWRYAGEPASDESLSGYSDAASVSEWAAEAMSWALETGVIEGVTATTLQPQGTATRAQCATIFMRYDALVA